MTNESSMIDLITAEVVEALQVAYGRAFRGSEVRQTVLAYYWPEAPATAPSPEDREALACGAALSILGTSYRPPSPTTPRRSS